MKFLENQIEDFDYYAQQLVTNAGMTPDDFDKQDYYRMQEIMQARSEKDRPEDPMDMLKRLGIQPGGDV